MLCTHLQGRLLKAGHWTADAAAAAAALPTLSADHSPGDYDYQKPKKVYNDYDGPSKNPDLYLGGNDMIGSGSGGSSNGGSSNGGGGNNGLYVGGNGGSSNGGSTSSGGNNGLYVGGNGGSSNGGPTSGGSSGNGNLYLGGGSNGGSSSGYPSYGGELVDMYSDGVAMLVRLY